MAIYQRVPKTLTVAPTLVGNDKPRGERVRVRGGTTISNCRGIIKKTLSICLISLLLCSCLTTKGSKNAPAFRGLTGSEAERLEALNNPGLRDLRPKQPEKDDSPENLAETAEMFLQNGDFERSLYNYSKILSQNPERHDIRYKLGVALLLSGKLDEAKKELAEVLLHKMDMLEAHEALGVVYLQENNITGARQEFSSVLALDPKRLQSRCFLGETCLRANQFSQALTEFKAAQELAPTSAKVLSNLGWTYFKMKDYDQSLQYLKKVQAMNPSDKKLNHRLGMVLAAQKKFPEALEAFRKAGDEAQAFNNVGVHYYLEHRYGEAARCFQKALDLRPVYYQEAKVNLEKALARLQDERPAEIEPNPVKGEQLSWSRHQPTNNKDLRD
jgi:Flp pilus assembly protein TadD